MISNNPVRELWFDVSIAANHGSVTGNFVSLEPFAGPVTVLVTAGPGLAAPVSVSFQAASEDPSSIGSPLLASAAAINKGGFCDDVEALTIELDPAAEPYATDGQQICRDFLRCPAHFVRAILSVADPAVTVHIMGKAKRMTEL